MDFHAMEKMNADDIGSEVDNWEDNRWEETESKTTFALYRNKDNKGIKEYMIIDMVWSCCSSVE